jgi:hypothetical protein
MRVRLTDSNIKDREQLIALYKALPRYETCSPAMAAAVLGIGDHALRQSIHKGTGPTAHQEGPMSAVRIFKYDLERYIEQQKAAQPQAEPADSRCNQGQAARAPAGAGQAAPSAKLVADRFTPIVLVTEQPAPRAGLIRRLLGLA